MGKVLSRREFIDEMRRLKSAGRTVVFTNGCFDILHVGHARLLAQARALGDVLGVAVNSDSSVRGLKGPTRPVVGEEARAELLAALAAVDLVTLFDEPTPAELIRDVEPSVLVKGGDYRPEDVVGRDVVEAAGGHVRIIPLVEGFSSTSVIRKATEGR